MSALNCHRLPWKSAGIVVNINIYIKHCGNVLCKIRTPRLHFGYNEFKIKLEHLSRSVMMYGPIILLDVFQVYSVFKIC